MPEHAVLLGDGVIRTARLTLRPWVEADAEAALAVYGQEAVARWLSPAMEPVRDVSSMRALLEQWAGEDLPSPQGRWAVLLSDTAELVGGVAALPLPPEGDDLEIGYQLVPHAWGRGIAAEAGHAVAHHAFTSGTEELFAVVRQRNLRGAATARRMGMEWVGETDKYYDLRLQVYRLRKGELDISSEAASSGSAWGSSWR